MQAIGFIETRGLVAAIEAADAMLKAAEVHLVERTFVKGGIVTITITGDVAACKASVDAGAAAVNRMSGTILSTHVIPRPHESLDGIMVGSVDPVPYDEDEDDGEDA
jgi:microcompartment protein CcmL/EutN